MKTTTIAVLGALLVLLSLRAGAQEKILPEKKKLIDELLEITGAKNQADRMIDNVLRRIERNYPQMMMQTLLQAGLKDDALLERRKDMGESFVRFSKRFRELWGQRIDTVAVIEQISYPLYDKYFTEDELKEMIRYYQTPTGKKASQVMGQLSAESSQRLGELINDKVTKLINDVVEEEKMLLMKQK